MAEQVDRIGAGIQAWEDVPSGALTGRNPAQLPTVRCTFAAAALTSILIPTACDSDAEPAVESAPATDTAGSSPSISESPAPSQEGNPEGYGEGGAEFMSLDVIADAINCRERRIYRNAMGLDEWTAGLMATR